MEEGETVTIPSRKEMRKQKLMEYLAAKGKLKQPNSRTNLQDGCQLKKPVTSAAEIVRGKENTAPADKLKKKSTKIPNSSAQATKNPVRRAFGDANKVEAGRQKIHHSSATSFPPLQKLNQKPVLTKTYTVSSSKNNMNSASLFKKQPSTGITASGKTSSNAARTAATKPNNRFSSSSKSALLRPIKTVSVRMSLGPIVKTKTGLIPAVTQPRNSQIPVPTTNTASAPTNVRSSTSSSVSTSLKKTWTITALKNQVNETARARIGVQNQNRDHSKTLNGQQSLPSFKSRPSGLKTTTISSKCTAAPNKPEGRVGMLKPSVSTSLPSDTRSKQRSETEGKKNIQPCKVVSRTSSRPASRCSFRPAGAELEKKTKTCRETDGKKGSNSSAVPSQNQAVIKRIRAPVISHTAPQPARTISLTGQARKTQKVPVRVIPQTEGKKLTAVQEERMKKLQEWREARGISYKRPPMPVRPQVRRTMAVPQPFWTTMTEEDEAHSLISAVDRSLADCIKLLGEGYPTDQVKEVLSRLPVVSHKFAKYWICQARLMEQEGNLDVLPLFEQAVGVVLEPMEELRTVVFEILKKKDETKASEEGDQIPSDAGTPESVDNPMMTPKPVRALICGEKGDSSVVKYKITATPGGPQSQQKEPARVNGQEVRFFTPVRRSVRIERASLRYPVSLQDHDLCVASYNDLISEEDGERSEEQKDGEISPSDNETPMYVYRENEALKEKVFVQLVYDDCV
ncbi:cytoskeleton-associated protein 2-like [Notolabrus celidotus]|uniref:cytoskeleton-associated protein 2-like n=1 Tax=Notolabrus celidotus TaxID=1203425 RepID=UPI00148FDB5E|nr:cytoskeleton-associated protein 2-like [Notolabrus celidotus]